MRRVDLRVVLAAAPALLLIAGCEVRQDADPDDRLLSEPSPEPTPEETVAPVASIIRDDSAPETPPAELPPRPLRLTIPFADGGNALSERAERLLAGALESRAIDESWPITLRGHTDSEGNDRANLRASRSRAEAVAAWLVEEGVDDERIEVVAIGEQNPIAPNALPDGSPNEEGRARNRRVELVIAPAAVTPPRPREGEGEDNASQGAATGENEGA